MDPHIRDNLPVWSAIILLVSTWLVLPIYLQLEHGFSAVKVSFGITIIYYLGFKIWKYLS